MQESAFKNWQTALRELNANKDAAESWRHDRYQFAYKLGMTLAGPHNGRLPSPHVVYAVWLDWGLLYIGQTSNSRRRLRDLPIGESHHLGNTYPPEIWNRVVVISWPYLPEAQSPTATLGADVVGLALEHRLQSELNPLANASRRTPSGSWRPVNWSQSRSVGALARSEIDELFAAVRSAWDDPLNSPACRVVYPTDLL